MAQPLCGAKMNAAAPAAASIGDSAVESLPASNDFAAIETPYLKQLKVTHRARARAAMGWRSRFLKGLASSWGCMFALRSAGVSYNTFRAHERNDPEFAAQVREAEAEGAQLLHDVCWKRAMEGDLEPVFWQGQIAGYVRKFDTRLQIEFLRGYQPERFKRPGTQVNVGTKGSVFVLTEEERHELQRINRQWLEENSPQNSTEPARALPIGSGNGADIKTIRAVASE